MLFSIDSNRYIHEIPHEKDYRRWRGKLNNAEFEAIRAVLRSKIGGAEIHTSSWIPGNDWSDTVYDPIYSKACDMSHAESAKCFGLFLWTFLQEHPDTWAFGRYEKNGIPINGLTYFKLSNPPARL